MATNKGDIDKSSGGRAGAKIIEPYGRDNSSHKLPGTKGGSFGGSIKNLSHSLPGTSANQKG